jgi:hypothetical protein
MEENQLTKAKTVTEIEGNPEANLTIDAKC